MEQNKPNEKGLHHWLSLRIAAIALIPLGIWLIVSLIQLPLDNYHVTYNWMGDNITALLMIITVLIISYHATAGMKEVYIDYIHSQGLFLSACYITYALAIILDVIAVFSIYKIWHTAI